MFARVSGHITDRLIAQQAVASEERELYEYGFRQGFTALLNILTAAAVGALFGCMLKALLFLVLYIPLRSFAGGHHARTPWLCYVQSVLMLVAVCLWIRYVPWGWHEYPMLAAGAGTVFLLAPAEAHSKPLDDIEMKVYRKRALLILAVQAAAFPLLRAAGLYGAAQVVCCVICMMALMLIIR